MRKVKFIPGILAVLGILLATGCQDMDNDIVNDQNGRLVLKLTDAPFPFDTIDAAMVHITKVEIRKLSEGEEIEYPFITLFENFDEPLEYNLLDLRNGITTDLVDMDIEAGNYNLIRLYVGESSLTFKEGETYSLKVPSGEQTGIKIFMDPVLHVAGGLTTEVILDFSVEKSFLLQGNLNSPAGIKGFHFKPVIRAAVASTSGTVEGFVMNSDTALASAYVLMEQIVDQDTLEVTSASTDEAGYYAMTGIPAGLYRLSATLTGFDTVTVESLEIVAGNLTSQDFILTKLEDEGEEAEEE